MTPPDHYSDPISPREWELLNNQIKQGFTQLNETIGRVDDRIEQVSAELKINVLAIHGQANANTTRIAVVESRLTDGEFARWIDRGIGALVGSILGAIQFLRH